jgi:histone acetyltransferase (RNA polymerase elongator complex component)
VESRPELLDAEFLTALLNAGCVEVKVGIESLEEDVLLATRRVTDRAAAQRYVEAVEALTKTAADLRILVRPFVMTGMPGATPRGETRTRRQAELLGDPVVKRVQYPQAAPAR